MGLEGVVSAGGTLRDAHCLHSKRQKGKRRCEKVAQSFQTVYTKVVDGVLRVVRMLYLCGIRVHLSVHGIRDVPSPIHSANSHLSQWRVSLTACITLPCFS